MERYLIRLTQVHESFRLPEIEALAKIEKVELEVVEYSSESPFCIVRLSSPAAATALISRSIFARTIDELWADATTIQGLHARVREDTAHLWDQYRTCSFKFCVDSFNATRSQTDVVNLIESFSYLGFDGPISLKDPDQTFCLAEEWPSSTKQSPSKLGPDFGPARPRRMFLGRRLGRGAREVVQSYDLKKRRYISTTSMDSELALATANIALARPGTLFYDPFAGTGSFPIACAHFGAVALGSDIDGRTMRGRSQTHNVRANFEQYGLGAYFGDLFAADITNSPIRVPHPMRRLFDGLVCDPPYGVREGLHILGCRDSDRRSPITEMQMLPSHIPQKRPCSFPAMLDAILDFAARTLVDDGRLAFWMPTASEHGDQLNIPVHPCLELIAVCTQTFNRCESHPEYRSVHSGDRMLCLAPAPVDGSDAHLMLTSPLIA